MKRVFHLKHLNDMVSKERGSIYKYEHNTPLKIYTLPAPLLAAASIQKNIFWL